MSQNKNRQQNNAQSDSQLWSGAAQSSSQSAKIDSAYQSGMMSSGGQSSDSRQSYQSSQMSGISNSSQSSKQANQSIQCVVKQCAYHCNDKNYCTLEHVLIGTHEMNPTDPQCTDCQSFKLH